MAKQAEAELADAVKAVKEQVETLSKVKSEVDEIRPQVEAEHEDMQASLYIQFATLQSAVERRKQALLKAARELKDEKISLLEKQSLRLEGLIDQSVQGLQASERILSSCTEMEVLQFADKAKGRLKAITAEKSATEPCANSSFDTNFDLAILKQVEVFGSVEGVGAVGLAEEPEEDEEDEEGKASEGAEEPKAYFMTREAAEAIAAAVAKAEEKTLPKVDQMDGEQTNPTEAS